MTRALLVVLTLLVVAGCAVAGPRSADRPDAPAGAARSGSAETPAPATTAPGREEARRSQVSYVFPVRGRTSYSRAHHDYPASDIFAGCGSRVVAPVGGVLLEVRRRDRYRPQRDDPALRGGRSWSLRGDDGVRYYGSHLRALATAARAGGRVRAGDLLGRVGQSGNARGTGCHLHFGISPVCAGTGDWRVRRGTVWPYRFLRAWERDRDRSPARAVRAWRAEHGCPARAR